MVQKKSRKAGFTLVELLVVIGIIGLLVSILVPSLSRARDKAQAIVCQSNVRQLIIACQMFAQDNKGNLPRPSDVGAAPSIPAVVLHCVWPNLNAGTADLENGPVWKFLGGPKSGAKVIMCPGDLGEKPVGGHNFSRPRNYSYSMNGNIVRQDDGGRFLLGVPLGGIKDGATKIMWYEELAPNDTYGLGFGNGDDWPSARHGSRTALNASRQQGGIQSTAYMNSGLGNYGFFDGHVESLSPSYLGRHPQVHPLYPGDSTWAPR